MITPRIDVRMPDAPNVAASNTAVFKLPIGRRFHELQMTVGGTAVELADISEIRVIANEKVIHRYSATERDSMNQFDGRAAWHITNNPILVIPFDRYNMKNREGEEETALDTGSVSSGQGRKIRALSLECDIIAGVPADMSLALNASQSTSLGKGAGTVLHVLKDIRDAGGAGEYQFGDLPYNAVIAQALNRVFIKPSANDFTRLKVDRDTYTVFDRTKVLNESIQSDGVRVPQSGWVVIDKSERGYAGDPIDLRGVTDYRYVLTATGAMSLTFLSEYLGGLGD